MAVSHQRHLHLQIRTKPTCGSAFHWTSLLIRILCLLFCGQKYCLTSLLGASRTQPRCQKIREKRLRSLANLYFVDDGDATSADAVDDPVERRAQKQQRSHFEDADLVVAGKVVAVRLPGDSTPGGKGAGEPTGPIP